MAGLVAHMAETTSIGHVFGRRVLFLSLQSPSLSICEASNLCKYTPAYKKYLTTHLISCLECICISYILRMYFIRVVI